MSIGDDDSAGKAEFYNRANVLKGKVGLDVQTNADGQLDPEKVKEADDLIKAMCKDCNKNMGEQIEGLVRAWAAMAALEQGDARTQKAQQVFTFAHDIKDIAALCGYGLAAHFAESLRDYVTERSFAEKNQRIIIQAHIDALIVIQKNDIKDDAGAVAEELKEMVAIAVNKYK